MHSRGVAFEGAFNIRDLGGIATADGHLVRAGRLYRADDLNLLTEADYARFAALGIRTVVDLRRPIEVVKHGRVAPSAAYSYHNVHIKHPQWIVVPHADTAHRVAYLRERYREMANHGGPDLGEALRLIADADRAPLIFHCRAGKDRTGLIAALTLHVLGVDDDTIADDYHLSDAAEPAAWARYAEGHAITDANPRAHIDVAPRAAMLNFLDDLRAEHGSIEAYVAAIGVTPAHVAAMRAHLLDTAAPSPTFAHQYSLVDQELMAVD
jgi:protein tyrosine/serine phosphatase